MASIPGGNRVKTRVAVDKEGSAVVSIEIPGWRRLVTAAPTLAHALYQMAELAGEEESTLPLSETAVRRLKIRRRRMHPLDGEVSRQRLHALAKVARGLCQICGAKRHGNALFCERCRRRKIYLDKEGIGHDDRR